MAIITPSYQAAIISVGGSVKPILHSLRQYQPDHIWFLCSPGSKAISLDKEIYPALIKIPDYTYCSEEIIIEQFEELGPCYKKLRREIRRLLDKYTIPTEKVLVDYTGGTKTMSAALVLAATEIFSHFSYIGGKERDKGGMGITIDDQERFVYQSNPWHELAVRELEQVAFFWNHYNFDASASLLEKTAKLTSNRAQDTLCLFAQALAARERLAFGVLKKLLQKLTSKKVFSLNQHPELSKLATTLQEIAYSNSKATLLQELLDNALRAAEIHRYEDAAARLYRACEMYAQIELERLTDGIFNNGRCASEKFDSLPLEQQSFLEDKRDQQGNIKLASLDSFRFLAFLGHETAKRITYDIEHKQEDGKSSWLKMTSNRNDSVLAHGCTAITQERFDKMKAIIARFLPFDLSAQRNSIPRFDLRWVE